MSDNIPKPEQRRGPWSKEDKEFIKEHAGSMSPEDIGRALKRNPEAIKKYIKNNGIAITGTKVAPNARVDYDLKCTPHWRELEKQFNEDELESFLYHWNNTIKQFRDDVLHTEELQIIDMIKLEVMMNRLLNQERDMERTAKSLEEIVSQEKARDPDQQDKDLIFNTEKQIAQIYSGMESINREYRALLIEKNKILDKLKATREQRIKDIQSSKESIPGWIRNLVKNQDVRRDLGYRMEKMRLAAKEEYVRLSDLHEYMDGKVDIPVLNHETVMNYNDEDKSINEGEQHEQE